MSPEVIAVSSTERALRTATNPLVTGPTRWWHGSGRRHLRLAVGSDAEAGDHPPAYTSQASPGHWIAPPGVRPGRAWLPEHGALPNLRGMPRWVRVWYRTPFLARFAYEWMWWHGGWFVLIPSQTPPGHGYWENRRPGPTGHLPTSQVVH
jgi:hypothetical protein